MFYIKFDVLIWNTNLGEVILFITVPWIQNFLLLYTSFGEQRSTLHHFLSVL